MGKGQIEGMFRQEALERLRSPDRLDKLFSPTTPVGWIALASVLLLVLSVLFWSFFGVIATKVNGIGLIMDTAGVINITHSAGGRLSEMRVKPGDRIRKGQVIAIIEQPALEAQIARNRQELNTISSREDMAAKVSSINEMRAKLERDSEVVSPVDGIVADQIVSGYGDIISPGSAIVNLRLDEKQRGEMMALVYVPVLDGKKIQIGMMAQISPGSVEASEYGTLVGQVQSVSSYPVLADSITGWTGNKELTAWILGKSGGAVVEVQVNLIKDSTTASGYLWSSIHGAPDPITPGTMCTGSIVVKQQAPITKGFLKLNQWVRSN